MTGTDPSTRADGAVEDRGGRARGVRLFLRDILIIFLAAIIISVGIKAFLVRSFYIPSGSMENTLQIDDRIIVNQLVPNLIDLERGDVVVFQDPGGWLPPSFAPEVGPIAAGVDWFLTLVGLSASDSNDHLIKRVIGLPGDVVTCCNAVGQMEINGVPLDEPYLKLPDDVTAVSGDDFSVEVPAGSLWVMGDNRYSSKDSRYNTETPSGGFVPIDNVVGRAFVITYPIDHWSFLDNYPSTFRGVDAGAGDGAGAGAGPDPDPVSGAGGD
ncbi:signal peptidase I [Marisediminicola senii]|uniref:signal peptidase I n=1 Tax=Marisediminicola senii TaxID=2711233 RepID=UPI0013EAB95B|nr:signal peptidase I [Marisediminicola senii]